jgi:mRNA interferase MazF
MKIDPRPGEVYFVDLGLAAKARSILVVSIRDDQAPLAVITGLSFTRQYHRSPYEVVLPKSVANKTGRSQDRPDCFCAR